MHRSIAFPFLAIVISGCVTNGASDEPLVAGDPLHAPTWFDRAPSSGFSFSIGTQRRMPPYGYALGRKQRGCRPLYALDPFWSRWPGAAYPRYRQVGVVC
jgi:hypothetical protein